jgi:HK97 family phage major capsid protein
MSNFSAAEIKSIEDAKAVFLDAHKSMKDFMVKAEGEIKETGKISTETKAAMEALATKANEYGDRIDKLEARLNRKSAEQEEGESLGSRFVNSEGGKALLSKQRANFRMQVKAIINATGQNQPLVPSQRLAGIITEPNRRMTVRDLIPVGRTSSNLIEYTRENVFTNSAAPQYDASPAAGEGSLKAQSNITFTLATAAVVTIAHYIKTSKQVLADAPQLESYINSRLIYGLKLEEEDELLNSSGASGELNGLRNQATAYNRGASGDTRIDTLRKSMTQVQIAEYSASGFVLNPGDWESIELLKDGENRYLWANPRALAGPSLWGLPVVVTNAMPAGNFLSGAFDMAAQIWDREDAAVMVGYENDDFTRNLVTILAEERLALTVYRPLAFVKGTY